MNTVKIYQLNHLSRRQSRRCKAAQMEAAKVWNSCMETHKAARMAHTEWPGRDELQKATKGGQFELHSQSVQMVVGVFLANIKTTRELRQTHPQMQMKYPYHTKGFYPVKWPAQAVSKERGRVVLPMGRSRAALVLPLDLPENSGACTLVWNNGYELHVCLEIDYLTHKSEAAHIMSFTGSERGTSSRCPKCGHKHKPKGRNWVCRNCQFSGHRDLVGSVNMHQDAYENHDVQFPRSFTYLRPPGLSRRSSSRADTPQSCLSKTEAQPRTSGTVSSETGHASELAQKPVPF